MPELTRDRPAPPPGTAAAALGPRPGHPSLAARKLEKRAFRLVAQAITDYGMIADGDRVLVGISGGKDSYILLDVLSALQRRAPIRFELIAVHVDQHIPGGPTEMVRQHLERVGARFHIEDQNTYAAIAKLIPDGKNACSLCARLRRGVLYRLAEQFGCNRLALGHQMDDVVSTLLLNMFYGGRLKAMSPVLRSSDHPCCVIRPLIYLRERECADWARFHGYQLAPRSLCGVAENRRRREIKELMRQWDQADGSLVYNLFMSTTRLSPHYLADRHWWDFVHHRPLTPGSSAIEDGSDSQETAMRVYSPAFATGQEIPLDNTQEGADRSPPLVFEGVPAEAKSLVLIADDPDAPDPAKPLRVWLHWLIVDLPPDAPGLPEGTLQLPDPGRAGINDGDVAGWSGPRPPIGEHRYFFRLYALDVERLPVADGFRRAEVEAAMRGHVLAQAETYGVYTLRRNR